MGKHRDRFELSRTIYGKALVRLHEVLLADETPIVRDALIQRFEFTYELAWKSMFYWLRDQGEDVPEMVRAVLQAAFRTQLITDADLWERVKSSRDATSHTYNEDQALDVASFVRTQAVAAFDVLRARLDTL